VRVLAALVASLALPAGGVQWWSITPVGHSLLVAGSPPAGALCAYFVVDTTTLKGRGRYRRSCDRPPVATHRVAPVVVHSRTSPYDAVTVAGKVVMHYRDGSDTRPQSVTYGRSLWLYDVYTSDGPEVLRFDARSGELLQRTPMPRLFRPVMIANGDGLWLDPATNGGIDGVSVVPVLHVGFGDSPPVVVHRGGRAALWMAASAHTVWFEQIAGRSSVSIWRIDHTTVRLLARPGRIGFQGVYGDGKLWELTCGAKEHLLRVDPDTGSLTPVGQFPRGANYCDTPMTVVGGKVFVLDGQTLHVYGSR
jgi:outer membrane protein assembly factor BamB